MAKAVIIKRPGVEVYNECLESLIQSRRLVFQNGIWVFAPHPDDEDLGPGGIMAKNPKDYFVICMTDGGGSKSTEAKGEEERKALVQRRMDDDILGLEVLHLERALYLEHREIKTEEGKLAMRGDLELLFGLEFPECVFVPSPYEFVSKHPEVADLKTHRLATELVIDALRKSGKKCKKLYGYEVWDSIPRGPDIVIEDISGVIKYVLAAMTCHRTETRIDFIGMKEGKAKEIAVTYKNDADEFDFCERFLDMTWLLDTDRISLNDYRHWREENHLDFKPRIGVFN